MRFSYIFCADIHLIIYVFNICSQFLDVDYSSFPTDGMQVFRSGQSAAAAVPGFPALPRCGGTGGCRCEGLGSGVQTVVASVVPGNHAQTGRPAVHGVQLLI